MGKVRYWIGLIYGILFLTIALIVAILLVLFLFKSSGLFGSEPELIILLFTDGQGGTSMIPVFIGLLALSGALMINPLPKKYK